MLFFLTFIPLSSFFFLWFYSIYFPLSNCIIIYLSLSFIIYLYKLTFTTFFYLLIACMFKGWYVQHSAPVREQHSKTSSFCPVCGTQESNLGHQTWLQAFLTAERTSWPYKLIHLSFVLLDISSAYNGNM